MREDTPGPTAVEIVLDPNGLVLGVAGQRLVGDVARGVSLESHIHPDDYASFLWSAQGILNGHHVRQSLRLRWARPGGRWSTVNVELTAQNGPTVLITFHPDEVQLAQRNELQFRRIVEGSSASGIVVRDSERVLYQNDAFAHMLGYASTQEMAAVADAETKAGRNQNSSGATHPDDRALVAEQMRRRIAGEETVSDFEFRLLRRDGSTVWVHTRATVVNWDGQVALLSWLNDISARKAIEAELIQSKEAAESANRAKSDFLASMSHELRTPLNAVIGFAEVIRDELFGPVGPKKYLEYANDIHSSGRHLLDLIDDVLDLSRLESGKLELRERSVALATVIDECMTVVRLRAQECEVVLATDIEPGLPNLICDERALKQVLLNLLSNAVKFTPAGGTVTTGAALEGGNLAIWVRDTGFGMNQAEIRIALIAFGQIDSKVTRLNRGAGLGLPISKSLIELHGGTLTVDSAPGIGTTMTASFPASRVAAWANGPPYGEHTLLAKGLRGVSAV